MISYKDELYHHGIKGQKWGVRRYQDPTGKLTAAGQRRYNRTTIDPKTYSEEDKKWIKQVRKQETKRIDKEHRKEFNQERDEMWRQMKSEETWAEKLSSFLVGGAIGGAASGAAKGIELAERLKPIHTQYYNVFAKDLKSPSGKSIKFVDSKGLLYMSDIVLTEPNKKHK